jgi:hypothetical protein
MSVMSGMSSVPLSPLGPLRLIHARFLEERMCLFVSEWSVLSVLNFTLNYADYSPGI